MSSGDRRRHARRAPPAWGLHLAGVVLGAAFALTPGLASASVVGKSGIEIEGPRDRRGFYVGPGLSMGASFFRGRFVPQLAADLTLGGGITKRVTMGLDLSFGGYLPDHGFVFGGDVELTGFVFKGLYLRPALGVMGVPKSPDAGDGVTVGLGGRFGLGYEFWLNQSAALAAGLAYDLRVTPQGHARHGALVVIRFLWY